MPDIQTHSSPETQSASAAVLILSRQFVERYQKELVQMAQVAFETDKLDPQDGWRYDVFTGQFVKESVPDAAPPQE
jgi:hypothetical protein